MKKEKKINTKIARIFFEMADIYEIQNIKWKPQAYRLASQTIESLRYSLTEIYKQEGEDGINALSGIGEGMTKKIVEFIRIGRIKEFEDLKKTIPAGLYNLMKIPGIGPKKASLFYNKLGIKNVQELKKAAQSGRLKNLPGFKEKSEKNVLEGLGLMGSYEKRTPLKEAEKIVAPIVANLKRLSFVEEVVVAGSFRRKKPTIGDIDIVVKTSEPEGVISAFVKMKFVKKVLGKGEEKASVIIQNKMQVDLRVFTSEEFGAGLLYFTGDKQHNIWLRKIAIKKGLKLNEYGLFDGKKRIAGKNEKEIYDALGIKMIAPEKRIGEVR